MKEGAKKMLAKYMRARVLLPPIDAFLDAGLTADHHRRARNRLKAIRRARRS